MGRILQALLFLLLLGALAVIGFAYLGDMSPEATEQRIEVQLPGSAGSVGTAPVSTEGASGN